ncbi:DUF7882 family protein [Subtercola boreus]|uniref:DUF7882 domain-containing protein n=1 Tax=Subtercola boreus TaxID=120213 RepID=A0A3E0W6J1_9MICO|nr:ATP-dependent DNA ligase [Subtercola boreus]RFA18134.1 hypothetical protein B7R24_15935 [Subtercola boreus]RFA18516.1 hypothetical protein B7R23_15970 [Subtercola boreus]RFA25044.1 hypothetical protein B7R25_15965 [Subtercola boreus]
MGNLTYGPAAKVIAIDDRDLAHLQVVMLAKLRRGEAFAFSWDRSADFGSGHNTLWIHPSTYVEFNFFGSKKIPLNRTWVDALMKRANSSAGLELISEVDAEAANRGLVAPAPA